MKRFIPFIFLFCLSLHASITLTNPEAEAGPNNTNTGIANHSISNLACTQVAFSSDGLSVTVSCFFGTVTTSGTNSFYNKPQDVSFVPSGDPPITINFVFASGVVTVTSKGQVIYTATETGNAYTIALAVLQGQGSSGIETGVGGIKTTCELDLIQFFTNSSIPLVAGTQNDVW